VFAVTQISHYLLADLTLLGAAQALLLWFAVWLGWQYTCWITNWFDPERLPIRAMLFGVMLLALPMAAAIPQAFGERGLVFAACYAAIQVGRSLFVLGSLGPHHALTPNYRRILGWNSIAALFWIGGAFAQGNARMLLWAAAVAWEYVSPMFGFALPGLGRSRTTDWTIEGGHLAERCQLFIIVALGEGLLLTGATLSQEGQWSGLTLMAFGQGFVANLVMWWIYFDTSSKAASHTIAHAADPGRMGSLFHSIHVVVFGHFPRSHALGLVALALLAALAGVSDVLWMAGLTSVVLLTVALWDGCTLRAQ
jgi:low temperature requirement protein LtrA